ncbi:class I SAM-dependent methyltransferase [Winogradskyella sp.]
MHNYNAAEEVVPLLIKWFSPQKVVDVGCGIGTWLSVFEKYGVSEILGVDGDYVKKEQLTISIEKFIGTNLEEPLKIDKQFDLVISLEVAEHLSESSADSFIDSICKLGDTVLFSAAIKTQGGQNHINEQRPNYWISAFKKRGYELFDVLRPVFWNNENVDWWYKQNMMIFTKNDLHKKELAAMYSFNGKHLVHPILFENRSYEANKHFNEINRINEGNKAISYYFNLFVKALKMKLLKR